MVLTAHTVQAPIAHPSLDIWALGVLLYEVALGSCPLLPPTPHHHLPHPNPATLIQICSSQHLFPRNFTNDNVTDLAVKCRLCTWHTMSDEQLKEVYEQLVNKGT